MIKVKCYHYSIGHMGILRTDFLFREKLAPRLWIIETRERLTALKHVIFPKYKKTERTFLEMAERSNK